MKKKSSKNILIFLVIASISFLNLNCKKDKESADTFCDISRTAFTTVDSKEGMIGYYAKHNRWAVYAKVQTPNNIDTRIIGLSCDIPSSLQIDGLEVIFSGNYMTFNANENVTPQIGGDELYYVKISKIIKK